MIKVDLGLQIDLVFVCVFISIGGGMNANNVDIITHSTDIDVNIHYPPCQPIRGFIYTISLDICQVNGETCADGE